MNAGLRSEYFKFLDELRESGVTNMFGAGPFLEEAFGLSHKEAQVVLVDWMRWKEKQAEQEERETV